MIRAASLFSSWNTEFGTKTFPKKVLLLSGVVLLTSSLEAQWIEQPFPSNEYLWGVRFVDQSTGWLFGNEYVYKTTDEGITWIAQDTSMGASEAFYALDSQTAFYANYSGVSPYTRGIRRTTNGGTTWETVDSETVYYTDFEFITPEVGYAAGGTDPDFDSILRKTTDGGSTWFTVSIIDQIGSFGEFEGISFVTESEGWSITYMGTIYHTVDGGETWSIQDSATTVQSMRDIQFVDANSGWAVGGLSGDMRTWRTTDGGNTWMKETEAGNSLREIQMLDSEIGWRIGMSNSGPWIGRTTDGGMTWSGQEAIPEQSGFESIWMVSEDIGWAVSWRIYKTVNGGVSSISESPVFPDQFSLAQNYPNPFNPNTTISFAIPTSSFVTLSVYDVIGQKVATLVNDNLSPGTYAVPWDASGRSSGVYFYLMQAHPLDHVLLGGQVGQFIETRKLVLTR